jgi:hypothetical protein
MQQLVLISRARSVQEYLAKFFKVARREFLQDVGDALVDCLLLRYESEHKSA